MTALLFLLIVFAGVTAGIVTLDTGYAGLWGVAAGAVTAALLVLVLPVRGKETTK